MCPLRIILIFLSATLAGFFVLRNMKSPSIIQNDDVHDDTEESTINAVPLTTKVSAAAGKGFWTCVDMASGRYMWRNMFSATQKVPAE